MPFLLAALGIAAGVIFWVMRARNAAHAVSDLMDVASDIRAAARRFGFRRRHDQHPVEAIEDPNMAAASLAVALLELGDLPSEEQKGHVRVGIAKTLDVNGQDAEELMILGHWMVNECHGAQPAVSRLSKKLFELQPGHAKTVMERLIDASFPEGLDPRQEEARDEIRTLTRPR